MIFKHALMEVVERGGTRLSFVLLDEDDDLSQVLDVEQVVQLRKALDKWLDRVYPEPEAASDDAGQALPAVADSATALALARQEGMITALREAMAELPALIRDGVGKAVAQGMAAAAPAMAEQAAAAMASLRPDGNQGYVGRGGEWRPPSAIQYGDAGGPGGGLMGQPPLPGTRVPGPPRGGVS